MHGARANRGSSIVEMMIVATIFVLVATSVYRTLTNLTQLKGTADSAVVLELEGQKALNTITDELRTAGFFRPQGDNSLLAYNSALWVADVTTDAHPNFDVPYLWAAEGSPNGAFISCGHTVANHQADSSDEEFGATREMSLVTLGDYVKSGVAPSSTVQWSAGALGATATIVMPVQWQVISYELFTDSDNVNRLKRLVRPLNSATFGIGAVSSTTTLAQYVEAVRFDTAQTDASLALYTVKITIWLRKQTPSGQTIQAKVQAHVKLRNSVK
jgi:hypothetical protein